MSAVSSALPVSDVVASNTVLSRRTVQDGYARIPLRVPRRPTREGENNVILEIVTTYRWALKV